jgi:hypothetical protein
MRMSSAALAVFRDERELAKQTREQREISERLWKDSQGLLARFAQ